MEWAQIEFREITHIAWCNSRKQLNPFYWQNTFLSVVRVTDSGYLYFPDKQGRFEFRPCLRTHIFHCHLLSCNTPRILFIVQISQGTAQILSTRIKLLELKRWNLPEKGWLEGSDICRRMGVSIAREDFSKDVLFDELQRSARGDVVTKYNWKWNCVIRQWWKMKNFKFYLIHSGI